MLMRPLAGAALLLSFASSSVAVELTLRDGDGTAEWAVESRDVAVVLVDVWSNHWCGDLKSRVDERAPAIGRFVEALRSAGVTVVHAPSAPIRHYAERKAVANVRQAMSEARGLVMPEPSPLPRPALATPFRGMKLERCVTGEVPARISPLRQHEAIRIDDSDFMSVSPREIWALGQVEGFTHLLYVGFAAGNCVLGRQFGMLPMAELGFEVALVRDMTDVDFTVVDPPMSNADATDLVVREIEKTVGPSVTSTEVLEAFGVTAAAAR